MPMIAIYLHASDIFDGLAGFGRSRRKRARAERNAGLKAQEGFSTVTKCKFKGGCALRLWRKASF